MSPTARKVLANIPATEKALESLSERDRTRILVCALASASVTFGEEPAETVAQHLFAANCIYRTRLNE